MTHSHLYLDKLRKNSALLSIRQMLYHQRQPALAAHYEILARPVWDMIPASPGIPQPAIPEHCRALHRRAPYPFFRFCAGERAIHREIHRQG
ncbi:hypothetical protein EBL_c27610 [Shimwellia blattae DSM 4481 = NBRC 105725]|uniref:Uncharacterized protein n=2 Tax=Shimwellia blattae TaxID=563 RepID=I2BBC8_SHIBC|nr:hypothetical protein EBL_c27610 [Shimwellia blattae DSM 4481 = NBRC 105725]